MYLHLHLNTDYLTVLADELLDVEIALRQFLALSRRCLLKKAGDSVLNCNCVLAQHLIERRAHLHSRETSVVDEAADHH